MAIQNSINEKMRAILVDWLVEVQIKFKLLPETLYLTVNIIDRFLGVQKVTRDKLQLVGVSSMLIATKYEEIYAPEVKDFVYISDNAYSSQQILDMEFDILRALEFNVTTPSSYRFVDFLSKYCNAGSLVRNMCYYLTELSLVEYKLIKYRPSLLASASMYLAQKMLNKGPRSQDWGGNPIEEMTKYTEREVKGCAKDLCLLLQGASKCSLQAVQQKFASSKYKRVSQI